MFEVKKVLEEYRYELIQRHMILGRDVVLKSWQSKELFEDSSSNLTKIVEDLKKSHPNTSEEDLVRLFDSAKLEINEYYTKCTIGDKVIYVDYCSRDFKRDKPMAWFRKPTISDSLEDIYLASAASILEPQVTILEYQLHQQVTFRLLVDLLFDSS